MAFAPLIVHILLSFLPLTSLCPAYRVEILGDFPLAHQSDMAAVPLRFMNLTAQAQANLKTLFRGWAVVPAQNPGNNQRAITAGQWRGIPPANDVLATGGEGIVHVWCQVDPVTNVILDRVVVKQVVSGHARFNTGRTWVGGINHIGGQPMECHQANLAWAAQPTADRQYILSCLGWGDMDLPNCQYKLYFEYCDYGNMNTLMKVQKNKRKGKGKSKKALTKWPEPFLWYMFQSLAKACWAMESTHGINPNSARGMLHGDLHPGNLLFGEQDATATSFGLYPVPKVADFGSARRITPAVGSRNGGVNNDPMLLEFAPPELSWIPGVAGWEIPNNITVSKKSNIYQIGLIMAAAIRLKDIIPETEWRRPPPGYNVPPGRQLRHNAAAGVGVQQMPANVMNPGPKKYSNTLINLVMTCLNPIPTQRPSAANLLASIQAASQNHGVFENTDTLAAGATISTAMRKNKIEKKSPRWAINKPF